MQSIPILWNLEVSRKTPQVLLEKASMNRCGAFPLHSLVRELAFFCQHKFAIKDLNSSCYARNFALEVQHCIYCSSVYPEASMVQENNRSWCFSRWSFCLGFFNAPGNWHNSRNTQDLYVKLFWLPGGWRLVSDSAIPRRGIESKILWAKRR